MPSRRKASLKMIWRNVPVDTDAHNTLAENNSKVSTNEGAVLNDKGTAREDTELPSTYELKGCMEKPRLGQGQTILHHPILDHSCPLAVKKQKLFGCPVCAETCFVSAGWFLVYLCLRFAAVLKKTYCFCARAQCHVRCCGCCFAAVFLHCSCDESRSRRPTAGAGRR